MTPKQRERIQRIWERLMEKSQYLDYDEMSATLQDWYDEVDDEE